MIDKTEKIFFILMGPSGCGKGTQATLLKKYLTKNNKNKTIHFSTGEYFRYFMEEKNLLAKITKQYMLDGLLMPEGLAIWNWINFFIKKLNGKENIILDGAPRRIMEANILENMLDFMKYKNVYVIYYKVSDQELKKRIISRHKKENRVDDTLAKLKHKLAWFKKDVLPIIKYYRKSPKVSFIEIDANQSVENIFEYTIKALEK